MNVAEANFSLDEAEFTAGSALDTLSSWHGLTQDQHRAIETIVELIGCQPVISLDGAAGTGKTTAMRALVAVIKMRYGIRPVVVTPTNKAATVLQSKGVPAATLFARFFTLVEVSKRPKKMVFEPNDKMEKLGEGKIACAEVVIVDEASMLTSWALNHLKRMCDTVILVGDGNQLPPVGDQETPRGQFCTRKHDVTLTQVLRNRGSVLKLASDILQSKDWRELAAIDLDDYLPEEDFEVLFVIDRPQLICWRNVVRRALNARARKVLGFTNVLPVPGDLMLCRDNYDDKLLNGTQVVLDTFTWTTGARLAKVVLVMPDGSRTMANMDMLRFFEDQLPVQVRQYADFIERFSHTDEEGAALTYGYAVTAHAAQGGEWPVVVVVDERAGIHGMGKRRFAEDQRNVPADEGCRRWTYTAVSRAQETVYVVDERWCKY